MVATHIRKRRASVARAEYPLGKPAPHPKKSPAQGKVIGLLAFLLIPGFLLATSLPALAVGGAGSSADAMVLSDGPADTSNLQSVAVSANADIAVERGDFTAETHEQVAAKKKAAAIARARAGAYRTVGPQQAGDDYPWRSSGGGLSPLGYVVRQCTDFAAWRLNRDRGTTGPFSLVWSNMTPGSGSASRWAAAWNAHGWATSTTPIAGSIAWQGNHVAYVKSVNADGTVNLEEYNWGGSASYHTRTVPASANSLYLYPPP